MTPPLTNREIEQLVIQAQKGDEDAFAQIFDAFFEPVSRYVRLRTKPEEAEDTVNEIFLKVVRNLPKYSPDKRIISGGRGAFAAWIFRISRNQIIDLYRKQREQTSLHDPVSGELKFDFPDPRLDPQQTAEQHDAHRAIHSALKKLPSVHREILELKFLHEFTNSEISEITNKSEGAIRVAQLRALRELRKFFPND